MAFWSAEVKPGETCIYNPGESPILRLFQASCIPGTEPIGIFLRVDGWTTAFLGNLSRKCPVIPYDMMIEKRFELSHNSSDTSVYFLGLKYPPNQKEDSGAQNPELDIQPDEGSAWARAARLRVEVGFIKKMFWGAKVVPGEPRTFNPEEAGVVRLTKAFLRKPDGEDVVMYVEVDGTKSVLGVLSAECTHISSHLFFDTEFKLSHSSMNASVHFLGSQIVETKECKSVNHSAKLLVKEEKERTVGNPDRMKVDSAAKKAPIANDPMAEDEDKHGNRDNEDNSGNGENLTTALSDHDDDEATPNKDASSKRPAESASIGPEKKTKVVM